jgi:hypothetical protein
MSEESLRPEMDAMGASLMSRSMMFTASSSVVAERGMGVPYGKTPSRLFNLEGAMTVTVDRINSQD